jgi:hypothetical protein
MRPILLPIAVSAFALSVAGCGGGYSSNSTPAEQEMSRLVFAAADYKTAGDACYQKIADNKDYAPLNSKTVVDAWQQFTLPMLNNEFYPNKREMSLLSRLYTDYQECRKFFMEWVAQTVPQDQNAFVENFSDTDKLWMHMTGGGLTWAQFNQSRKDLSTQREEALNQATAQVNAQLQRENQAELAQQQLAQQQARAAAIAGLANGLQNASNAYGRAAAATSTYQPPPPPPVVPSCAEGYQCMGRTLQADGVWR